MLPFWGANTCLLLYQIKLYSAKLCFPFQTHAFDVDFAAVVQRGNGAVKLKTQ